VEHTIYTLNWGSTHMANTRFGARNIFTQLEASSWGSKVPHHQIYSLGWGPTVGAYGAAPPDLERAMHSFGCKPTDWGPTVQNHLIWSAPGTHCWPTVPAIASLRCRTTRFGAGDLLTRLGAYSWGPAVPHHQIWSARYYAHSIGGRLLVGLQCCATGFSVHDVVTRLGAYSWGLTVPHHQIWSARCTHSIGGLQCRTTRFGLGLPGG